jgi:hypothetical protein
MSNSIHDMNEAELLGFISQQENLVNNLLREKPGSPEHQNAAQVMRDAKQLSAQKRFSRLSSRSREPL